MDNFSSQTTSESSIRVDHREGLSFPNAAVQALIKPFARIILKPPPPAEDAGSPRINPHKAALEICHVEESMVAETWTYTFSNKAAEKQSTTHKLYYFCWRRFQRRTSKRTLGLMCGALPGVVAIRDQYCQLPTGTK